MIAFTATPIETAVKPTWEYAVMFDPAIFNSETRSASSLLMHMCLRAQKGAVVFSLATSWHLPVVQQDFDQRPLDDKHPYDVHKPVPYALSYHSPVPLHDGQQHQQDECSWLHGAQCFGETTKDMVDEIFVSLVVDGHTAVWDFLRGYYLEVFDKTEMRT